LIANEEKQFAKLEIESAADIWRPLKAGGRQETALLGEDPIASTQAVGYALA
jgi:hypothetical protein